jgi:multiple sugar transport system substrate-binding protein
MSNTPSRTRLGLVLAGSLVLAACGGGGFEEDAGDGSTAPASAEGPVELQMLIASSGDAETAAVQEAVDAWVEETGNSVTVTAATDMNQQLAQGFAGGDPADVFYMDAGRFADYAQNGSLYAYADQISDNEDFYEPLRQAFTYDGTQYCAPKDFSTLALVINTASWEAAGLTEDDIPTTWDELASVAQTLTTGDQVGLGIGIGIDRLGAFVVQNGGWWLNEDGTEPTAATPEVEEGLAFVQEQVQAGSFQMSNQLDSGWGGEAFGTERAAMTIEGNWIKGAMENDYPDIEYVVAELPEGPAGKGTLTFTQCWGIAADSDAQAQAVELVEYLTTVEQQQAFADAFGVMPSRSSAAAGYEEAFPEDAAFIAGGEYGQGPVNAPGMEQVVADLNSKLEAFGTANLPTVLSEFDTNAASVLGQ